MINDPESQRDWLERAEFLLELRASRDRWKKRAHYLLGVVRHYRLRLDTDLRAAESVQDRLRAALMQYRERDHRQCTIWKTGFDNRCLMCQKADAALVGIERRSQRDRT